MLPGPKTLPSQCPITGSAWPGYASCQRISIMSAKPKKRKISPVMPYWIPITL